MTMKQPVRPTPALWGQMPRSGHRAGRDKPGRGQAEAALCTPAVDHNGARIRRVAGLDSAQECQEGSGVLGHSVVRPCCELEMAHLTLLARAILGTEGKQSVTMGPHFPGLGAFTLCPHHTDHSLGSLSPPQFPSLTPKCTNPMLTPGVSHPAPRACSSPSTALPYPPPSESKQSVSPLQLSPARPCTPSTFLQCWDSQTCSPPTHDVPPCALQSHPLYRGRTLVIAALGVHGAPSCPTANTQYTAP